MPGTRINNGIGLSILVGAMILLPGCDNGSVMFPDSFERSSEVLSVAGSESAGSGISLKRNMEAEEVYSDIYEKNLFTSDRTYTETEAQEPGVEPTATPKRAAVDLPDFELVGTLTSADTENLAFIKNKKPKDRSKRNDVEKYEIGDWIGDYMVSGIEPSKVTLTRGEELAYLRLKPSETANRKTAARRRPAARGGTQQSRRACGNNRRTAARGGETEQERGGRTTARPASSRRGRSTVAGRESAEARERSAASERGISGSACGGRVGGTRRTACGR
ncbi:MAG TPA: hypothetical protein PLV45_00535 [bacterium]|nr:hypothetical protein [bacterium]